MNEIFFHRVGVVWIFWDVTKGIQLVSVIAFIAVANIGISTVEILVYYIHEVNVRTRSNTITKRVSVEPQALTLLALKGHLKLTIGPMSNCSILLIVQKHFSSFIQYNKNTSGGTWQISGIDGLQSIFRESNDKDLAAMLDELTIEANEEASVMVLQHGGNDVIWKRSIVSHVPEKPKKEKTLKNFYTVRISRENSLLVCGKHVRIKLLAPCTFSDVLQIRQKMIFR